jgi:siroheme synthase-like protein
MRIFFPVSLNLSGRKCVVIGTFDDREAIEKEAALREAGADVEWIQDVIGLLETPDRLERCVAEAFFVISTPQDAELSTRLRQLADKHRFLLCCIDQPKYGFVAMAAIAKAGPVRIAISTAGLAPRIGKILKNALQRVMDARFTRFVEHLAGERERVAGDYPAPEESAIRREAMIELADGFKADVLFTYPEWFTDPERFDDAER